MKRFLSLLALFVTIGILLFLMVSLQGYQLADVGGINPKTLAATGFIILAAFSMGEVSKQLNQPALLGYIAAGVLFGPKLAPMLPGSPEALFSEQMVREDLNAINVLTIGIIGTMGGGELKIADIKRHFKTIVLVIGMIFILAVPTTTAVVLILAKYAPSIVPFLADASSESQLAAALLLGVFAMAMSPAATLAIIQESRAKGQFTSLVLGIVVVADIVLVEEFLLVYAFDKLLLAPEGFSTEALLAALPAIGAEIGYAIIIGVVTGLIFILFLRFIGREKLLFTVAIIFLASWVSSQLHAETLMAFLTAGFIVQNASKHGHEMIETLEKISLPVFVVYFMTQAALLDLQAVVGYIWLTLILTAVRALAIYVGVNLAARWSGASEISQRNLWLAFFSRGGVDLVLAAMVMEGIPEWGKDFQTVIMASVVIHIVLGPPLLKFALDRSGETEGSRRQTREEAESLDQVLELRDRESIEEIFPRPDFEDDDLNERVRALRNRVVELYKEWVSEPIEETATQVQDSVRDLLEHQQEVVEILENLLTTDEFESVDERIAAIHEAERDYLNAIAPDIAVWAGMRAVAVNTEGVDTLLREIQGLEAFTNVIKVNREESLFEPMPEDGVFKRVAKAGRRFRRVFLGPGQRAVPLGRLWRYYVELSLPRYLNRAALASAGANEKLWSDLGSNFRLFDEMFEQVLESLETSEVHHPGPERDEPGHADHSGEHAASISGEHEVEEQAPTPEPHEQAMKTLEAYSTEAQEVGSRIHGDCQAWASTALDTYKLSFSESYAQFVRAAGISGTISLPAWKYRPSKQFDRARRAETQLKDRLRRERNIVSGHRGWIVVEHQLILFKEWLDDYEDQVETTVDRLIYEPCQRELNELQSLIESKLEDTREIGSVTDWEGWLDDELRPNVRAARRNFEHILASFGQGIAARRLVDILESQVESSLAEKVNLFTQDPEKVGTGAVPTVEISVRDWFEAELVREIALRFVEFNERAQVLMRNGLDGIADVQQVLEFNLITAQREHQAVDDIEQAHQLATGALGRAQRMARELCAEQEKSVAELKRWFDRESNQIAEKALKPFLKHDLQDVRKAMERRSQTKLHDRGGNWVTRQTNRAADFAQDTYERWAPIGRELADEVKDLLVDEDEALENSDIRRRLHVDAGVQEASIPAIYRRLFTPVPLDIPDFYVERPEVEERCRRAIESWLSGTPASLMIHGDRGMGKRSTVHHLLQSKMKSQLVYEEVENYTVLFNDDLDSVEGLARELGESLGAENPETLDDVRKFVQSSQKRSIIVVENGDKIFQRTEEGLQMCRAFLNVINETSDHALWIILIGSPAVNWLDTALDFSDYFTHVFEMPPLDIEQIQQMILRRHRVSGFSTVFERPRLRVKQVLRHPFSMSEAVRDPQREFFDDLDRLSGGKPMLALLYWLESVRPDAEDDHLIHVGTLPDEDIDLIKPLSLTKGTILSVLVLHHSLTATQLSRILRLDVETVRIELEHLTRLGFVQSTLGRDNNTFQLRALAEALATRQLRDRNLV